MIHLICTLEPTKIAWLPQYVAHYRKIGVGQFLLTLQQDPTVDAETRQANQSLFERVLSELGVDLVFALEEPYDAMALRRHHHQLQDQFVSVDDWVVWCDSDEFQVYPVHLRAVISELEAKGIQFLYGIMIDRVAADGSLPSFDPDQSVWKLYSRCCNVTGKLAEAVTRKVALARGGIKPGIGNHYFESTEPQKTANNWVQVHHFKWHSGIIKLLHNRVQPEWQAKCSWWVESQRLLDYFAANGGRFNLDDIPTIYLNGSALLGRKADA